jgi:hypothetical protein
MASRRVFDPEFLNLEPGWLSRCSDYGLNSQMIGVGIPGGGGCEFFFCTPCLDRFWGPPSLLSNGYRVPFSGGKAGGACSCTSTPPIRLHGVVLS